LGIGKSIAGAVPNRNNQLPDYPTTQLPDSNYPITQLPNLESVRRLFSR
jgi:hypothetical protein